jgi:hypothetical protein
MKKILLSVIASITLLNLYAQKENWKEMHDFHTVMSKTFHPAEENNLQPTKDNATELLIKAKTWQSSVVPSGYDAALINPVLKVLVDDCTAIEKAVKQKKTDSELKKLVTKAHETFHEIMEKCKKEND